MTTFRDVHSGCRTLLEDGLKIAIRSEGTVGQILRSSQVRLAPQVTLVAHAHFPFKSLHLLKTTCAVPIAADRETEANATHKPILFRKAFDVNSTIASARLYITGLGIYKAKINGQRVGAHVLAPGYMSYQFRHTYDTYDVTGLLQSGENAIGVEVGEGWWSGKSFATTLLRAQIHSDNHVLT